MKATNDWLDWICEIRDIAQAGLTYGKDVFDQERYRRLQDIAAMMMEALSDTPLSTIQNLFADNVGYPTPKIDTRATIFKANQVLLVQEKDGRWALPGGWCEANLSIQENTLKEVEEEAGLKVKALKVLAIMDRNKHNPPRYAYGVIKVFVDCCYEEGSFKENSETIQSAYFPLDALPPLAIEKNTAQQIELCYQKHCDKHSLTYFD